MNRFRHHQIRFRLPVAALVFCSFFAASVTSAAPCDPIKSQPDPWVSGRINALVFAARRAYENEKAQTAYERVLDGIARTMQQCRLSEEKDFVARYPEFAGYIATLSIGRLPDHELGFSVSDKVYFAETSAFVTIPDFLLTPNFLRAVSRFEINFV